MEEINIVAGEVLDALKFMGWKTLRSRDRHASLEDKKALDSNIDRWALPGLRTLLKEKPHMFDSLRSAYREEKVNIELAKQKKKA